MTQVQTIAVTQGSGTASMGARPLSRSDGKAFEQILATADINISGHAAKRLSTRGMNMTSAQAEKVVAAVDNASEKGAKTSLLLMKELALLVRIPERTVVTAMSPASMRDGIVTQIDSAVVI